MPQVKQGNSLWIDYTVENWDAFAPVWDTHWTGVFQILTPDGVPVYSGTMTRSTVSGVFNFRLDTDSASTVPVLLWSDLPVGTYLFARQFENTTAKCRKEEADTLTITKQSIAP